MATVSRESRTTSLYTRLMGTEPEKLAWGTQDRATPPLSVVLYYAYQKGFWPLLRGMLFRPRLRACGGRFFLGCHTKLLFPSHLTVGHNVAIGDYVYLNCYGREGVRLGNNVRIREFGWVQVTSHLTNAGEGLVVDDDTYIGPHCVLGAGGKVTIGRDVAFGAYVQILAENHTFADPQRPINEQGVNRRGVSVGDGCWLGNGVIVLDGVQIGPRSIIGAGSVVTRDVPADAIVVGNPARVVRSRV